jgi:hypothetical protein
MVGGIFEVHMYVGMNRHVSSKRESEDVPVVG